MAVFRMPRGDRAPLPEVLDLLDGHIGVAGQVKQAVDQHRAMPRRQDKPVTVGPTRRLGVKLQVFFKQNRRHIGHAHRHARVAGIGGGHRVQRQRADGGSAHPMIGVVFAKRLDVHGRSPVS
jgi:hypothetical protein